jgi:hypothetical protein
MYMYMSLFHCDNDCDDRQDSCYKTECYGDNDIGGHFPTSEQ